MTTVINFNFLNFFRFKFNTTTVNNEVRSFNQYLDNRQYYQTRQEEADDVIDVTPCRKALTEVQNGNAVQPYEIYFTETCNAEGIYNRDGKAVQRIREKGLLVNSYA